MTAWLFLAAAACGAAFVVSACSRTPAEPPAPGAAAGAAAPATWRLPHNVQPDHYTLKVAPDLASATFTGEETIDVDDEPAGLLLLGALDLDGREGLEALALRPWGEGRGGDLLLYLRRATPAGAPPP